MSNGWTGGQYSLVRAAFGLSLAARFAQLLPWGTELFSSRGMLPDAAASPLAHAFPNILAVADGPTMVTALLAAGVVAGLLLAAGVADRAAAVFLWYLGACLLGRNPLIANPSLPYVGWLLLAHAALPAAPYGSGRARGRVDPGGGWSYPPALLAAAWVVMAVGYSYSGLSKLASPSWLDGTALPHVLANPLARPTALRELLLSLPAGVLAAATWGALALEILYAPLALVGRLRPWVWLAMVTMHVGLVSLVAFAELSLGMLLLHAFTFDPAWVPARAAAGPDVVRYDGGCGVCHGFVRFLLSEDREPGGAFRFSPLEDGASATTVIVDLADGRRLERSDAVLHVLHRLGGMWRVMGVAGGLVPRPMRDAAYRGIASVRRHLAAAPAESCPMLPKELRRRFVA